MTTNQQQQRKLTFFRTSSLEYLSAPRRRAYRCGHRRRGWCGHCHDHCSLLCVDRNKQRPIRPDILNSYVSFYVVVLHQSSSWLFSQSKTCTGCRIGRNRSGFAEFLEFKARINTLALLANNRQIILQ